MGLTMANLKAIPGGGGGAVVASAIDPYPFTEQFERAVAALCVTSRDFYARIGAHLDPKALRAPEAINLLKAAKAIAEETGEGPSAATAAIQRLRTWREDGKLTYEAVMAAVDYVDAAEDAGLPALEETINEVAGILKRRGKKELARKTIEVTTKDGDILKIADEARAIDRIGQSRQTLGESLSESLFDQIVADNAAARFPTGCMELDSITGGGLPRGYTLFLGREKSGKSMVLSSVASHALLEGKNVALATLELAPRKQMERILANVTALPLSVVQTDSSTVRYRYRMLGPRMGKLQVSKFAPDTPVQEITRWVDQLWDAWGKVDLLVVDYADLVGAGKPGKDASDYRDAKVVGNLLRDHAMQRGYVTISATQGRRSSGTNGKPLDLDDVADSQHKVRLADLVIAMRMDQDAKDMVDWYVILNRDGTDRVGTTALPTDRSMARMFPVNRREPWR